MPMAGDWIKIEHWTQDKPEVFQMADLLNIDPDAVLGKLIRVWVWADQQTTNGNAGVTLDALQDRCINVTRSLLDRLAGVPGFASAMEKVGWLKSDEAGLWFANFDRHNGETAKTRALTAKRVQKHRAKKGNATVTPAALPREEKRREDINPPTPPESGGTVNQPTGLTNGQAEKAKQPTPKELRIEAIYQAYPRKVAKKAALTAIEKALKEATFEELLEATQDYARRTAGAEPSLIPHPATWYNRHGWLDDRRDWDRVGRKTPQNGQPGAGQKYDPNIRLGAW
jgi:hypothetical protein